jgi:hypothetical protein
MARRRFDAGHSPAEQPRPQQPNPMLRTSPTRGYGATAVHRFGRGSEPLRCWFDVTTALALAEHAAQARHHRRSDAEDADTLPPRCPGGLEVVIDRDSVTLQSTGWPSPLADRHRPDSEIIAYAIAVENLPDPVQPRPPHVVHLHPDDHLIAAMRAATRPGFLVVAIVAGEATGHVEMPGTPTGLPGTSRLDRVRMHPRPQGARLVQRALHEGSQRVDVEDDLRRQVADLRSEPWEELR